MVAQLQVPAPDSQPLRFDKRYPRSLLEQFLIMIRKNFTLYWRLTDYNAVRLFFTCIFGLLIGSIYWRKGNKTYAFPPLIHSIFTHQRPVRFVGQSLAYSSAASDLVVLTCYGLHLCAVTLLIVQRCGSMQTKGETEECQQKRLDVRRNVPHDILPCNILCMVCKDGDCLAQGQCGEHPECFGRSADGCHLPGHLQRFHSAACGGHRAIRLLPVPLLSDTLFRLKHACISWPSWGYVTRLGNSLNQLNHSKA